MKIAALFCALFLSLIGTASATQYSTIGIESWQCGNTWYTFQLGDTTAKSVYSITGEFSAANLPQASATNGYVRQSLVSVTYPGAGTNATAVGTPTGGSWQQSINGNLMEVNVKQTALNVVHVPVSITYSTPVVLSNGQIQILVNNATYNGTATVTNQPVECIDLEAHLVIQWGP